jgi:hypothetical protein
MAAAKPPLEAFIRTVGLGPRAFILIVADRSSSGTRVRVGRYSGGSFWV